MALGVLIVALLISDEAELALRNGELELAAATEVVLTLAETGVE
jgi:hypothetical protein